MDNIHEAVDSRSPESLKNLSIASTAAGMSFSNAGLGIAHSLAHSVGGKYDVLHGLVHPVLLPEVMRFNLPANIEKMACIGREVISTRYKSDEMQAQKGIEHLQKMFGDFGVTRQLRDLLPEDCDLEHICRMALPDACTLTNPREAGCYELMGICEAAW